MPSDNFKAQNKVSIRRAVIAVFVAGLGLASYTAYNHSQTQEIRSTEEEVSMYYYGNSCDIKLIDEPFDCKNDWDCRGDRKCNSINSCSGFDNCPSEFSCKVQEKYSCTFDSDCRGNRKCDNHSCTGYSRC